MSGHSSRVLIKAALAEDGVDADLTTRCFLPAKRIRARIQAKASGVFCGASIAAQVFKTVAPRASVRARVRDGAKIRAGQVLIELAGPRSLLSAERTALNFLQRLSGIATLTRRYADALRGTGVPLYDTRKTTPGWRALEKGAVRCGGGVNHRLGLHDGVMLKDNHMRLLGRSRWPAIGARVAAFRRRYPKVEVEIEAQSLPEVAAALAARPDVILLDNMSLGQMRRAIALIRAGRCRVEISGGVTLDSIRALARLKPDRISVGRITHSAPALDMSLETLS